MKRRNTGWIDVAYAAVERWIDVILAYAVVLFVLVALGFAWYKYAELYIQARDECAAGGIVLKDALGLPTCVRGAVPGVVR